jgi:hypothetical protein
MDRHHPQEAGMPHVVIEGDLEVRQVWERFEPILARTGDQVIKMERAFLDKEGSSVLLETLVVSQGLKQKFFIQVSRKKSGGVTVRLEPLTDPEKTTAVKEALGMTGRWVLGLAPGLRFGATNIEEHLGGGGAAS